MPIFDIEVVGHQAGDPPMEKLAERIANGVGTALGVPKQMGYEGGCPTSEIVAASTVSLPVWPGMTRADEDRVLISLERLAT